MPPPGDTAGPEVLTADRQKLTEPLGFVTALFGGLLLIVVAGGLVLYVAGKASIGAFGSARPWTTRSRRPCEQAPTGCG